MTALRLLMFVSVWSLACASKAQDLGVFPALLSPLPRSFNPEGCSTDITTRGNDPNSLAYVAWMAPIACVALNGKVVPLHAQEELQPASVKNAAARPVQKLTLSAQHVVITISLQSAPACTSSTGCDKPDLEGTMTITGPGRSQTVSIVGASGC
jgi:hypothetical protein